MVKLLGIYLVAFTISCANPGENSNGNQQAAEAESSPETLSADNTAKLPGLTVTLRSDTKLDTLVGYILGKQDHLKIQRKGSSNEFIIPEIPGGTYDLLIYTQDGEASVGRRINGINIHPDGGSRIHDLELFDTITVSGSASLSTDSTSKITVGIPGSLFSTEVDTDGNYSIVGVPSGKHKLTFQAAGFEDSWIEVLDLDTGSGEQAEMILTQQSTTGIYPVAISEFNHVGLALKAPDTANMFRISNTEEDLINQEWQSLASTHWMSFEREGEQTVFVQYSRNETNISAVFSSTFQAGTPTP